MKKNYLFVLSVIFFSFFMIANAEATSVSNVDTSADWDSLTILGGTEGTDYTSWFGKSSDATAVASTNLILQPQVGPNIINSWGDISATEDITDAKGYAYTTSALVAAESFATSNGISNTMAWSSATSNRTGYFEMLTPTALTFRIPYSYSHDISTSLPGEYASAASWVRFDLLGDNDHDGIFDDSLQWGLYGGMHNTITNGSGQFQYDPASMYVSWIEFEAGETYALNLRTYSYSYVEGLPGVNTVVPEPASLTLLGAGLFGIGFIRRRKKI